MCLFFCQPKGAADRCLDCSIETDCPYSACKIYMDRVKQVHISAYFLQLCSTIHIMLYLLYITLCVPCACLYVHKGHTGWPVSVICPNSFPDMESVTEALKTGPYGRCVYECDNDVCSNQVRKN